MLERLRPLAIFASVVEHGSFSAAADSLSLSKSVVSHHVARLEEALGVTLLYRSTRRLSVTRQGERLFAAAASMLEAMEAGLDEVSTQSRDPSGELRVTAPAALASGPFVDDVAAFAVRHPRVRLTLDFSDLRRDLVAEGIDVAIRMGRLEDSGLASRRLGGAPIRLIASAGYAAGRPRPRRPSDLKSWDWLSLGPVHRRARFRTAAGAVATIDVVPRLIVEDSNALFRLAEAGLGLAMAPDFLARAALAAGRVVEVLPDWRLAQAGIYAVRPDASRRRSLATLFIDFLAERERRRTSLEGSTGS